MSRVVADAGKLMDGRLSECQIRPLHELPLAAAHPPPEGWIHLRDAQPKSGKDGMQGVRGSSPLSSTFYRPLTCSLASASIFGDRSGAQQVRSPQTDLLLPHL